MNIKVDQLAGEVSKMLMEYRDVAYEDIETAMDEAEKTAKRVLSERAPSNLGQYKKGWRKKLTKTSTSVSLVVYASGRGGSITHLLEHGHAKRGGGRTPEHPHIGPAQTEAEELYESKLTKLLNKG